MKIGIPKELTEGEQRVAIVPGAVQPLLRDGHQVFIERDAGLAASFRNEEYQKQGGVIIDSPERLYESAELIVKVQPPSQRLKNGEIESTLFSEGSHYVGFLAPLSQKGVVQSFVARRISSFAMEFIPRITRAQSMDALSSMATIAGYKAVLIGASNLQKMFPLLMTAAGTVSPANVLILGAGVAGLQAIATAKRLGARVSAFDPRPAVREQVKSLGAAFIEMELPTEVETAGGYAKEQSPEFIKKEMEAISTQLPKSDLVITTAQVFGKRAPVLLTEEMVRSMKHGSIIIDLAAEQGGNCELTVAGQTVEKHGVKIFGALNLPSSVPVDASHLYSKNVVNLIQHLFKKEASVDFDDEIAKGCCITTQGKIVNTLVEQTMRGSS